MTREWAARVASRLATRVSPYISTWQDILTLDREFCSLGYPWAERETLVVYLNSCHDFRQNNKPKQPDVVAG